MRILSSGFVVGLTSIIGVDIVQHVEDISNVVKLLVQISIGISYIIYLFYKTKKLIKNEKEKS